MCYLIANICCPLAFIEEEKLTCIFTDIVEIIDLSLFSFKFEKTNLFIFFTIYSKSCIHIWTYNMRMCGKDFTQQSFKKYENSYI